MQFKVSHQWRTAMQIEWIKTDLCLPPKTDSGLRFDQMTCMGLSTLRNTFITWNRHTGAPLHNFIVWKDLRSSKVCKEWNKSMTLRAFNLYNRMLYAVKRCNRTLSAAHFKLVPGTPAAGTYYQISALIRFLAIVYVQLTALFFQSKGLLWLIQNSDEVREKMLEGSLMYGTAETWLIYKLTGKHVTEASSASITGLFDIFEMTWNTALLNILQIPMNCLPEVIDNDGDFGKMDASLFGVEIPITAVIADQQSAMFGECCFERGECLRSAVSVQTIYLVKLRIQLKFISNITGDMKLTLGTGSFLSVNTGSQAYPAITGSAYPAIGWKLSSSSKPAYILESDSSDTGTSILWAQQLDFFEEPTQTICLANSVPDSGGVYFVPVSIITSLNLNRL